MMPNLPIIYWQVMCGELYCAATLKSQRPCLLGIVQRGTQTTVHNTQSHCNIFLQENKDSTCAPVLQQQILAGGIVHLHLHLHLHIYAFLLLNAY